MLIFPIIDLTLVKVLEFISSLDFENRCRILSYLHLPHLAKRATLGNVLEHLCSYGYPTSLSWGNNYN